GVGRVECVLVVRCFFFSSRRRHTRLVSDWSSDVCSSDLETLLAAARRSRRVRSLIADLASGRLRYAGLSGRVASSPAGRILARGIGRASGRERGGGWGGAGR